MELYRLICLHSKGLQSLVWLKKDLRDARVEIYKRTQDIRRSMPVMWNVPLWAFTMAPHKPKKLSDGELSWLTKELMSRSFDNLTPAAPWKGLPVYWEEALVTKDPVTEGPPLEEEGVWGNSRISTVVEIDGEKRGILVWCPI